MLAIADIVSSDHVNWMTLGRTTIALLAIVDPFGCMPLFLSFTGNLNEAARRRTAIIAAIATAIILIAVALAGAWVLDLFGIRVASLRVAGGMLLLLIGLSMLHSRVSSTRQTLEEQREAVEADSVAIVPLAMPLMAGPGAISLVLADAQRLPTVAGRAALVGVIVVVSVVAGLSLLVAEPVAKRLGRTGINVGTRIMGLILAAIAVEMMANGLTELFPVLAMKAV